MILDIYLQALDLIGRESGGLGHLLEVDSIVRVSVGHGVVLCSACWAGCGVRLSGGRAGAGEVRWLQQPDRPGSARWGGSGAGRGRATASQVEGYYGIGAACQGRAGGRAGAEMGGLEPWPGGPGESCGQPLCYNTNSYNAVLFPHAVRYTEECNTPTVLLPYLSHCPASVRTRPGSSPPVLNIAGNLLITFLHFHQMYKEF